VASQGRSPLTVAGAVTDLAAVAYTVTVFSFHPASLCACQNHLPSVSHAVLPYARPQT
jgi:hypothetical protein